MRIYLDLCAIQRPLDSPDQIRIILESEAVLGLISLCHQGNLDLLSSDALLFEGEQNTLSIRFDHTMAVLSLARETMRISDDVETKAAEMVKSGFKPLDALHLALAEKGQADFFCTVDDGILRLARRIPSIKAKVINPIDLIQEIEK